MVSTMMGMRQEVKRIENRSTERAAISHWRGNGSDLRCFSIYAVKDCLVCRVAESTGNPGLLIGFISPAQSFWAIVKSIAKGLMNTFQRITTGHEDLELGKFSSCGSLTGCLPHPFECRGTCTRMRGHKDGFFGHCCNVFCNTISRRCR